MIFTSLSCALILSPGGCIPKLFDSAYDCFLEHMTALCGVKGQSLKSVNTGLHSQKATDPQCLTVLTCEATAQRVPSSDGRQVRDAHQSFSTALHRELSRRMEMLCICLVH